MGETIVVDRLFEVRGSSHFVTLFGHHKIKGVAKFVNSTFAFFWFQLRATENSR